MSLLFKNEQEANEKFKTTRKCKVWCIDHQAQEVEVDYKDVKLQWVELLNRNVPHTYCPLCKRTSRIVVVYNQPLSKEAKGILDRLELTQTQHNDKISLNQNMYQDKFGKQALMTDFIQPYINGKLNEKFINTYGIEKAINIYTAEELKRSGYRELSEQKKQEEIRSIKDGKFILQ